MLLGMRARRSGGPSSFANFLTSSALSTFLTHSRAGGAMRFDNTGKLVWAPENILTYSDDLTNAAWTVVGGSVSADTAVSPYGTNGDTYSENSSTSSHGIDRGIAVVIGVPIIVSAVVKYIGRRWLYITFYSGAAPGTDESWFDIQNGALGVVQANATAAIESLGNDWYRISSKVTPSATGTLTFGVRGASANNTTSNYAGLNGPAWYQACTQFERVTYQTSPSSYNATTTAAYYGPRFDYNQSTLAAKGLLLESARTNVVLWNRDLTAASWTKTNVTAAKDQTGIDGVTNSASKITATAGNGTTLQAITLASSARFQSAYVKRVTGSGVVEMTMDNGATWTAVTVTADWTLVSIPTQTLANPTVGFRIVTSGDAIAVDYVQNENGAFASSPIFTTTASIARATDIPAAALYTSNPAIIQYRAVDTGNRARKSIDLLSSISSEINEWIEQVAVYPVGTSTAYRDAHLTVDGPY